MRSSIKLCRQIMNHHIFWQIHRDNVLTESYTIFYYKNKLNTSSWVIISNFNLFTIICDHDDVMYWGKRYFCRGAFNLKDGCWSQYRSTSKVGVLVGMILRLSAHIGLYNMKQLDDFFIIYFSFSRSSGIFVFIYRARVWNYSWWMISVILVSVWISIQQLERGVVFSEFGKTQHNL